VLFTLPLVASVLYTLRFVHTWSSRLDVLVAEILSSPLFADKTNHA
jgi:hypothetical protein